MSSEASCEQNIRLELQGNTDELRDSFRETIASSGRGRYLNEQLQIKAEKNTYYFGQGKSKMLEG